MAFSPLPYPSFALQSFLKLQPSQRKGVRVPGVLKPLLSIGSSHLHVETRRVHAWANLASKLVPVALEK